MQRLASTSATPKDSRTAPASCPFLSPFSACNRNHSPTHTPAVKAFSFTGTQSPEPTTLLYVHSAGLEGIFKHLGIKLQNIGKSSRVCTFSSAFGYARGLLKESTRTAKWPDMLNVVLVNQFCSVSATLGGTVECTEPAASRSCPAPTGPPSSKVPRRSVKGTNARPSSRRRRLRRVNSKTSI